MAAEYPLARVGLTRSYVSCKLCALAGHGCYKEIMHEMQPRHDLNGEMDSK